MEQHYSTGVLLRQALTLTLSLIGLSALSACPSYEDDRSGTYREEPQATNVSGELLELELFRYGDYSKGIVRVYQSSLSEEPFSRQSSCAWTDLSDAPTDEGTLRLHLAPSAEQQTEEISFSGTFIDDQTLELTLNYPKASPPKAPETKRFALYKTQPSNRCDTVGLYTITLRFDIENGTIPNELPVDSTYSLRRPTFAALWLGVKAQRRDDSIVWVANQSTRHPIALSSLNVSPKGLSGDLTLSISSPDDDMLVSSGSTRYAIAHPIVIDDNCARDPNDNTKCDENIINDETRFSWDISTEPIIATALEFGQEQTADFPPQADGLGKAILFVEGNLSELHPNLQNEVVNIDKYTQSSRYNNRHFYIVDIFFDGNDIIGMRLPDEPQKIITSAYRNISLRVTPDYLNTKQIPLPRRKPIDEAF